MWAKHDSASGNVGWYFRFDFHWSHLVGLDDSNVVKSKVQHAVIVEIPLFLRLHYTI